MEEQKENIKKLISDSSSFAIVFAENSLEQEILCAQALNTALFLNECGVYQLSPLPESFKQKWTPLIAGVPSEPIPQITSIKIPAGESEVKEISYEKEDGFLNLHISSGGKLNKEGITVEQRPAQIDLVLVFGDAPAPQISYKNIFYFAADERTISEKTLEAIKEIKLSDKNAIKKVADLTLASLIVETDNFTRHFSPHTLEAGKELLEMGADKKTISTIMEKAKSTPLTQLLGRAMSRTRTSEDSKISWTFLSKEDFEKSSNPPPTIFSLTELMQKLRSLIPAPPTMITIWQDESGVEVMIKNFDDSPAAREKILALAQKAACPLQNDFFVMGPFKNFTEAEMQTQKMLKEESF